MANTHFCLGVEVWAVAVVVVAEVAGIEVVEELVGVLVLVIVGVVVDVLMLVDEVAEPVDLLSIVLGVADGQDDATVTLDDAVAGPLVKLAAATPT